VSRTEIVLAVVRCGDQICLARRSKAVATSRGLWSVVTGYVEPNVDPLTQAWTELAEELGLSPPRIRLLGRMEPVPLESPTSLKEFLVYPFLFECETSEHLVLNWEHDEVQWVQLSRLQLADCVGWQYPLVHALLHGSSPGSLSPTP
jgi:ribose 1,5-bisphosphate isomerase